MILNSPLAKEHRLQVLADLPPGSVMVHEIYVSIQGESTFAGLPCTFVRLTGCHLRCRWCDTPHAFGEGAPLTRAEVVQRVDSLFPKLVEVTGGEPLVQPETLPLLTDLAESGKTVLLETSGSLPVDGVDPRVTIICDLKCPSSGEVDANRFEVLRQLKPDDQIKFVIGDREDFDWAVRVVADRALADRIVLFSPVFGNLSDERLCQWILDAKLPVRFQPQFHKHVWGAQARGV